METLSALLPQRSVKCAVQVRENLYGSPVTATTPPSVTLSVGSAKSPSQLSETVKVGGMMVVGSHPRWESVAVVAMTGFSVSSFQE